MAAKIIIAVFIKLGIEARKNFKKMMSKPVKKERRRNFKIG